MKWNGGFSSPYYHKTSFLLISFSPRKVMEHRNKQRKKKQREMTSQEKVEVTSLVYL